MPYWVTVPDRCVCVCMHVYLFTCAVWCAYTSIRFKQLALQAFKTRGILHFGNGPCFEEVIACAPIRIEAYL